MVKLAGGEYKLPRNVEPLIRGVTMIMISHRLTTNKTEEAKMNMKKTLLLILSVLFLHSLSAKAADLFNVIVRGTCRATNDQGHIVSVPFGNAELIKRCADENGITNLASLTLVYDVDEDDTEVVNVSDGSVICESLTFSGGASVFNERGTVRERQAFIFLEDNRVGSFIGTEKSLRGGNGTLLRFSLRGKFQLGMPAQNNERAKVYSGIFTTGNVFVPANPPVQ